MNHYTDCSKENFPGFWYSKKRIYIAIYKTMLFATKKTKRRITYATGSLEEITKKLKLPKNIQEIIKQKLIHHALSDKELTTSIMCTPSGKYYEIATQ